jgi:hypothetical protein
MRVLENNYGWNPIDSAPFDKDVILEVTDGQGGPYRLPNHADLPHPAGSARPRQRRSRSRLVKGAI